MPPPSSTHSSPPIYALHCFSSQQPLQHLHVTALTEGCVFTGRRASSLPPSTLTANRERSTLLSKDRHVDKEGISPRRHDPLKKIVCVSVCVFYVYVRVSSYMCAKPQESLHWPALTDAHWQNESHSPFKESFCLRTWSNALFFLTHRSDLVAADLLGVIFVVFLFFFIIVVVKTVEQ